MEVTTIQKQIKNKECSNFYIFTGPEIAIQDVYIKKIAQVSNLNIIRSDSVRSIMSKLNSQSFIKQANCYVIHNDNEFIKAETSWDKVINSIGNNIVIFISDTIDKRGKFYKHFKDTITSFDYLGEDILTKYIQRQIDLSDKHCHRLIELCENDYSRILLEIDKIKQYSDNAYDETFVKFIEEGTIYQPPKDAIFDLVEAICKGQRKKSYDLLEDCKAINESPLAIIKVLYTNMKQMLQVQSCNSNDICKSTGLTGWQVKLAKQKLGYYSTGDLVYNLKLLQNVEKNLKVGGLEQDIAIDYILVSIL